MKIIDCQQGTPEWAQARAGRVTASRIDAVLARARDRKSEGATRRNYKAQLVSEILTGRPQEDKGFSSRAMEDGKLLEPEARAAFEAHRMVFVDQVGFVVHPTIERAGASPDGLLGADGLVQFKCPYPATHIGWMLAGDVPIEYQPQMLWEMACTERSWCDFVSYCPALPPHLQLFIARFDADPKRIAEITAEVTVFLREVDEIVAQLSQKAA